MPSKRIAAEIRYAQALARAAGGALLFSLPLFMTEEMWRFGLYMDRTRLALMIAGSLVLLTGVSFYSGFERTSGLLDEAMDALAAFAVGCVVSLAATAMFGVITPDMTLGEIAGVVAVCAVPAGMGAVVAANQLALREEGDDRRKRQAGYLGEMFLMAAGALFFGFNVAPTEETVLIAYKMSVAHTVLLALASLVVLHLMVYALGLRGQHERQEGTGHLATFLHYSLAGYGVALLVSLGVGWFFERLDGTDPAMIARMAVVMSMPASIGAAAARLVL
ncbi:MAG: TIGR02587 family membrane protein [Caulobacter sp.]